jgi:P27 family predicted phage terminase small subunit
MARPTKPTNLKLVEGNRGKRAISKSEPTPDYLIDLTPPSWLPEKAKQVFNELAPAFRKNGLLTEIDKEYFAQGCVGVVQFRTAVNMLGDDLVISTQEIKNKDGVTETKGAHINPWKIVQSMSFKLTTKVFGDFGASPAARTKILINPQLDLFGGTNPDETNPKKDSGRFFKS